MAIENVKAINIDTQNAQKSLADLRKQITDAKNALYQLSEGSDEYNKRMQELSYAQDELSNFMAKTRQGCNALEGSYNALSYQMGVLKQEWKATNDEARRAELTAQISEINDKLKDMDAEVGVFSRNVGNYTGSMVEAFKNVGINVSGMSPMFNNLANSAAQAGAKGQSAFTALSTGAKSLGNSLKALVANPVGAIIMGIVLAVKAAVAIFDKFKESVNRNEAASDNLAKAMAPVKAIVQGITNVFDDFVEWCTKGAAAIGVLVSSAMKFLGIQQELVSAENELADLRQSNQELERQNIVNNAQLELEASEARAKAADKENNTNEQRLAYAKEYAAKQQEIAANNLKLAEQQLKQLELEASLGKNDEEMNNKLAQAKAKVLNVQTEYNNTLRSTNKEIANITKSIESDQKTAAEAAKKHKDEIKKLRDEYTELYRTTQNALGSSLDAKLSDINKSFADSTKKLDEELKKKAITSAEYTAAMEVLMAKRDKELTDAFVDRGDALDALNQKFYDATGSAIEKQIATTKRGYEELKNEQKKALDDKLITEEEYNERIKELNIKQAQEVAKVTSKANLDELQKNYDKQANMIKSVYAVEQAELETKYHNGELTTSDYIDKVIQLEIDQANQVLAIEQMKFDEIERLRQEGLLSDEDYNNAIVEHAQTAAEQTAAIAKAQKEQEIKDRDETLALVGELVDGIAEYTKQMLSMTDDISGAWAVAVDGLQNVFSEVDAALKSEEKGFGKWAKVAAASCATVSQIFGQLADEQDENSKEGFEQAKKFRYAEAMFSMASGIMGVWPAAMELGPIAGPIVGAALSALISGIGVAQMVKIKNTKFGDTSGTGASVNAGAATNVIQAPVQYTAEVPNANIEEYPNRVYVLESDITATQNRVNVAESESRF